jgi:small subunit ribosomal protein S1
LVVTEEKSDKGFGGFGGPKKPKATFGDVMLGIPAGRERTEEEKPQEAKQATPPRRRSKGGEKGGERPHAEKPAGPMVVVKRASGVVEMRGPGEAPAAAAPAAETPPETAATAESEAAQAPVREERKSHRPAPAPVAHPLYEDVPEDQTFAEMFAAQEKVEPGAGRRSVRVGDKVTGTIFQLGADTAFISLAGGKSEAMIELRELKDAEGILRSGVGDTVEAFVTEAGAKGIVLTKQLGKGTASLSMLSEARTNGMPVEGLVLSTNKGGFEVAVGDVRAFCPISQMDLRFVEKPELFIGERLKFRVTEVRTGKVVLSRRSLLEDEQKALAAKTRESLAEGSVVKGRVTNVRDFGAFVDLGGVEGMIPVSEMSYARVKHPSELLKTGDEVEVEVIRIDPANPSSPDKAKHKERIALSMRSRQEDPWLVTIRELKEGDKLKGKVVRLQPFGAFVELRPGVDGLIHVSALSDRRIAHPRDAVQVGQDVTVVVEKIDPEERRIGLRLYDEAQQRPVGSGMAVEKAHVPEAGEKAASAEAAPQAPRPKVGQVVVGKVDRIEPFGVFVEFPGGRGLVPGAETGTERGTDLRKFFKLGQELKTSIIEIAGGKIRLSVVAAEKAEERAEVEAWTKSQSKGAPAGKGFGTFADLLKGKKL